MFPYSHITEILKRLICSFSFFLRANIVSLISGPSQLLAEVQKATPQAPVYATIRPSQTSQNRPSSSNMRSSLNSLPSALNSTPLVKSVAFTEEPPRFHPTNPFYTILPSNYSSASKLPIPNGKSTTTLDRIKKESPFSDITSDLKSPTYFTKINEGQSGFQYYQNNENINGYESEKSTATNITDPFSNDQYNLRDNQSLPNSVNSKNPFETKRNSDPFEKNLRQETVNGKYEYATSLPVSQSDNNFRRCEEITKHSVTEHKISEVEEVKTIKKIILNGSGDATDYQEHTNISPNMKDFSYIPQETRHKERKNYQSNSYTERLLPNDYQEHINIGSQKNNDNIYKPEESRYKDFKDYQSSSYKEHNIMPTPMQQKKDNFGSTFDGMEESYKNYDTSIYQQYKPYRPREFDKPPAGKSLAFK